MPGLLFDARGAHRRRPWPGYHLMAIAHSVTELQQRPPLHAVPDSRCPPALRQLVRQCWEADPRRRPAAAEAAKELALLREQVGAGCKGVKIAQAHLCSFKTRLRHVAVCLRGKAHAWVVWSTGCGADGMDG